MKTFPHMMQDTDVTVCAHAVCWIGVTLGQVSEVLTSIGFYPEVFVRNLYEDASSFYDMLYSYVESGIPVVAAMSNKEHAVAILGHGPIRAASDIMNMAEGNFVNARHCSDFLIINDDNYLPFRSLVVKGDDKKDLLQHRLDDVDGFVVPLYEKMYLSSENVLKLYQKFFYGNLLEISKEK